MYMPTHNVYVSDSDVSLFSEAGTIAGSLRCDQAGKLNMQIGDSPERDGRHHAELVDGTTETPEGRGEAFHGRRA